MANITFFEKPKRGISNLYYQEEPFVVIPVYMLKNNTEYFIANYLVQEDNKKLEESKLEIESFKKRLVETEGKYFALYCTIKDPMEFITWVKENNHSFISSCTDDTVVNDVDSLFIRGRNIPPNEGGFVDFCGYIPGVFIDFLYRIYDDSLIEQLKYEILNLT